MNKELRELVIKAGAPAPLLNEIWFTIFCQQFADVLLTQAEEEVFGEKN
jgi:hypothetical protein